MSRHTLLQSLGIVCAVVLLVYLGGDIAGRWEAKVPYSMVLSLLGLAAFGAAERLAKHRRSGD